MNDSTNQHEFKDFVNKVCEHIRANKLHEEIKEELIAHLEDHTEDHIAKGLTVEQAREKAIASMGDPKQIGRDLDKTHRPRTDWGLLVLIVLLSGFGLLAMYNVQLGDMKSHITVVLLDRKLMFLGIGIILMWLLWVMDYQKIKKYSEHFYLSGIVILLVVNFIGRTINGQKSWLSVGQITIHIPTIAVFLLLIGIAGMKAATKWSLKEDVIQFAYRGILPLLLLIKINTPTLGIVYLAVFIVHLLLTRRSWLQLFVFITVGMGALYLVVVQSSYLKQRILSALNLSNDQKWANYALTESLHAIRNAGWWGNGLGSPNMRIPNTHTEGLLPYFIYCLGWGAGIVVLILIFAFLYKAVITTLYIKDDFGKRLCVVIGTLFVIEYMWSVAMIFGYAPFVGISLPFISYGGTDQLIQFIAIGMLLSIYRRRNMIPRRSITASNNL